MDITSILGPAVVAAAVSGAIQFWGIMKSRSTGHELAEKNFNFNKELAERKIAAENAQLVSRRRFELAEQVLGDFYRCRDLIRYARHRAILNTEGESRKAFSAESESLKRAKDRYFVPIERIQKESTFLSAFMARKFPAEAHFGPEMADSFNKVFELLDRIQFACAMLIDMVGKPEYGSADSKQLRNLVWSPSAPEGDEIEILMNEAVALVERKCRPALEWKGA